MLKRGYLLIEFLMVAAMVLFLLPVVGVVANSVIHTVEKVQFQRLENDELRYLYLILKEDVYRVKRVVAFGVNFLDVIDQDDRYIRYYLKDNAMYRRIGETAQRLTDRYQIQSFRVDLYLYHSIQFRILPVNVELRVLDWIFYMPAVQDINKFKEFRYML